MKEIIMFEEYLVENKNRQYDYAYSFYIEPAIKIKSNQYHIIQDYIKSNLNIWFKKKIGERYRFYQIIEYRFDGLQKKHRIKILQLSKKMKTRFIYHKTMSSSNIATFLKGLELATYKEVNLEKLRLL